MSGFYVKLNLRSITQVVSQFNFAGCTCYMWLW